MFTKFYVDLKKFIKKNYRVLVYLLFVLLLFLTIFPRSVEILNQNPVFGFDQGRDYLAAKNIVVNHHLTLIGPELGSGSAGISGLFQGPFYYYFLALAFLLLNGNPIGGVYLMWILSVFAILFIYYFGKKLFNFNSAILAALLLAISPHFIAQARFAWAPYPATIFVLLSFYFTYFIFEKNSLKIFLAAFFAGFVYNFEFAVAFPLSLGLVFYALYIFREEIKNYFYLILGFLIAFSPMLLFEFRHGFLGLRNSALYLIGNKAGLLHHHSTHSFFMDHLQSFILNTQNVFPTDSLMIGVILVLTIIGVSLYYLNTDSDQKLKRFLLYLLFLIPVYFVVFSFLRNTIWNYYLTAIDLAYILLLVYIFYRSNKDKNRTIFSFALIMVIILTVSGLFNSIKITLNDYGDYGGTAKLKGKEAALDYIFRDAGGKAFGLLVFTPPVYTYPYDYLAWWYGERKYHYIPYQKEQGVFYLLIEPDSSKPWSYKGWLQTVVKYGNVAWTKIMYNGFIIQKRVLNEKV